MSTAWRPSFNKYRHKTRRQATIPGGFKAALVRIGGEVDGMHVVWQRGYSPLDIPGLQYRRFSVTPDLWCIIIKRRKGYEISLYGFEPNLRALVGVYKRLVKELDRTWVQKGLFKNLNYYTVLARSEYKVQTGAQ